MYFFMRAVDAHGAKLFWLMARAATLPRCCLAGMYGSLVPARRNRDLIVTAFIVVSMYVRTCVQCRSTVPMY